MVQERAITSIERLTNISCAFTEQGRWRQAGCFRAKAEEVAENERVEEGKDSGQLKSFEVR
jgi:hypothetical protein